jgi:hypothetical protein
MRYFRGPRLLVFLLLFAAVGCESTNKGKIEGTKWSSDQMTYHGQSIPPGTLFVHFRADGKLVYRAGSKTFTGTYSLGMGSIVTMYMDQEIAGNKILMDQIVIEGNKMTMTDPDGTTGTFHKVN